MDQSNRIKAERTSSNYSERGAGSTGVGSGKDRGKRERTLGISYQITKPLVVRARMDLRAELISFLLKGQLLIPPRRPVLILHVFRRALFLFRRRRISLNFCARSRARNFALFFLLKQLTHLLFIQCDCRRKAPSGDRP